MKPKIEQSEMNKWNNRFEINSEKMVTYFSQIGTKRKIATEFKHMNGLEILFAEQYAKAWAKKRISVRIRECTKSFLNGMRKKLIQQGSW